MAEFGERLKMLRKSKGMSQGDLADKLNYGYTAISNYESGRNQPSISDLKRLATVFEVSIDYLVGFKDLEMSKSRRIKKFGHYSLMNKKAELVVRFIIKKDTEYSESD